MRTCCTCKTIDPSVGEAAILNVWVNSNGPAGFSTQIRDLCHECLIAQDLWINEHLSLDVQDRAELSASFWKIRGMPMPEDCLPQAVTDLAQNRVISEGHN